MSEMIAQHETPHLSFQEKIMKLNRFPALEIIIVIGIGAILFFAIEMIPMPYLIVGLVPLGIVPSYAVVAAIGAVRGPIAGFLTGYFGVLISNMAIAGNVIAFSLYGIPIGVIGFIVGIGNYDALNDQSLTMLSAISALGLMIAVLLTAVFGIIIEGVAFLVAVAFQILPMITLGLPSVILLTPIFAKTWLSLGK